jgi:predicted nucleic acid-binding protein
MLIYCDSVILMYFFEYQGPFNVRASNRFAALQAAGDVVAISDLSRLECRVKPKKVGDLAMLAQYDAFFARPDVRRVVITSAVFDRATELRAVHNFKLADSLHLAAAIEGGCDRMLTNDARMSRCTDIAVEILP